MPSMAVWVKEPMDIVKQLRGTIEKEKRWR
jgi:hypothetical protein